LPEKLRRNHVVIAAKAAPTAKNSQPLSARLSAEEGLSDWRQHACNVKHLKRRPRAARIGVETFIQHADDQVAVAMVKEAKQRFADLEACSFDRVFHSPANQQELQSQLKLLALPRKGKLSQQAQAVESAEDFVKAQARHSAAMSNDAGHLVPILHSYWPTTSGANRRGHDIEDTAADSIVKKPVGSVRHQVSDSYR